MCCQGRLADLCGAAVESQPHVTKEKLCTYVTEKGWPNNAMVTDSAGTQTSVAPDTNINFEEPAVFRIWGIGRAHRNVLRVGAEQRRCFNFVEKGFFSFFKKIGQKVADSGETMLILEGPSPRAAGAFCRKIVLVTGIPYNPQVFDATRMSFGEADHALARHLTLPSKVSVATRPSKLDAASSVIDVSTSDEFNKAMLDDMASSRDLRGNR